MLSCLLELQKLTIRITVDTIKKLLVDGDVYVVMVLRATASQKS